VRPRKRLAGAPDEDPAPSKKSAACHSDAPIAAMSNPLASAPTAIEIRGFGLEDRAEAVISRGKDSWALANLSKWRHASLDGAVQSSPTQPGSKRSSKEYLRQRQRAYRQQCLAASSRHEQAPRQQPDS